MPNLVPRDTGDPMRRELSLPSLGGAGASSSEAVLLDKSELLASEQLSVAVSAEMQAQEHLNRVRARVQRELRKATSHAAIVGARERKHQAANAMRADMDQRVGRDLTAKIAAEDVPKATEDEVRRLSELFNQQLQAFHPDARNFFVLFKHIDVDGSRRISFKELERLIRDELRVSKAELPVARLHALWKVLDENNSGFIDPGELSRFMRIGRPPGGLGNRVRLTLEKKVGHQQQLTELAKRSGKHLTMMLAAKDVEAASAEEVRQLSLKFNTQLVQLRPRDATNGNCFIRLFKHMDYDDSGRISFKEFRQMVREELHLGKAEMPLPQLQSLWKALDENGSGYICIGEFGRFMRVSADAAPTDPVMEAKERQRLEEMAERDRNAALWKARAARKAQEKAKTLAAEAAQLEAALKALTSGGDGASVLPPINGAGKATAHIDKSAALEMLRRAEGGR